LIVTPGTTRGMASTQPQAAVEWERLSINLIEPPAMPRTEVLTRTPLAVEPIVLVTVGTEPVVIVLPNVPGLAGTPPASSGQGPAPAPVSVPGPTPGVGTPILPESETSAALAAVGAVVAVNPAGSVTRAAVAPAVLQPAKATTPVPVTGRAADVTP